jgi:hypothetical protein
MIPIFISKAEKAAKQLSVNPLMIWDDLLNIICDLRSIYDGEQCPSFPELLQFLKSIPLSDSGNFFMCVKILMETMTCEKKSFRTIMQSFVQSEDKRRRRRYVDDDVPPPFPGLPRVTYSCDFWRILEEFYCFQCSLLPITLDKGLVFLCTMVKSASARDRFYLTCVKYGSNPRQKLLTVSVGMFHIFLRKILKNSKKRKQDVRKIEKNFADFFHLNQKVLRNN